MWKRLGVTLNYLHSLATYFRKPKPNPTILDPLTCVFRLALLSLQEEGTKIRVEQNRITFQAPRVWQGVRRSIGGDTRQHIQNLFQPIVKATEWHRATLDPDVWNMAIRGMEKLGKSYPTESLVQHTVRYYAEVMQTTKEQELISPDYCSSLHKHLRTLWNRDEIKVVTRLLTKLMDDGSAVYSKAIDVILQGKEQELRVLLKNVVSRFA